MTRPFSGLASLLLLAACSSPGSGDAADPGRDDGAPPGPVVDRRVAFFEPRTGALMILVNEGHSGRATKEGRINIALGRPRQPYKVLEEGRMRQVLAALEKIGVRRYATSFQRGDERFLDPEADIPRYKGLILLQEGDRLQKVVARQPHGPTDTQGHRAYRDFQKLKGVVYWWYERSRSEDPLAGVSLPGSGS